MVELTDLVVTVYHVLLIHFNGLDFMGDYCIPRSCAAIRLALVVVVSSVSLYKNRAVLVIVFDSQVWFEFLDLFFYAIYIDIFTNSVSDCVTIVLAISR